MSLKKPLSALPLFAVLALLASGCGQKDNSDNITPQQSELSDIYGVYRNYMKSHQGQPPEKLSDFKSTRRLNNATLRLLEEGKYVVVWGVKDKDSNTVLAYEKDAPTNGGWAVMADGALKQLDASAFQNVPKPEK
jgi:hypothetical protein